MANILFKIPKWPDSNPRLIRWTDVVENNRGECFVVDTCNLIANPKDEGYFETTVTPYNRKVADDILSGKIPYKLEDPITDRYTYMWSGCGKYTIKNLRRKRKFESTVQAATAHLDYIYNL